MEGKAPSSGNGVEGPTASMELRVFLAEPALKALGISVGVGVDAKQPGPAHRVPITRLLQVLAVDPSTAPFKPLVEKYQEETLVLQHFEDDKNGEKSNFKIMTISESDKKSDQAIAGTSSLNSLENSRTWINLGSDKEISAMDIKPTREKIVVKATRKRKEFESPCNFSDKDAVETFSSSTMDCRPFKDQSYDKSFAEQEIGIQYIPVMKDEAAQTIQERPRNNTVQCQPQYSDDVIRKEILASEDMVSFLKLAGKRYVDALQQNEVLDLFEDDFAILAEEDDHLGHKSITVITEYQSFTDLTYGKGKMISAIDWIPGKHGMLAAACSEIMSFDDRLQASGKPSDSYVLIWSFSDPIHPQIILESASDTLSLRFNPTKPEIVAGGCYNGQVILWDISSIEEHLGRQSTDTPKSLEKEKDEKHESAPVLVCSLLSSPAKSHTAAVSDLHWLPSDLQLEGNGKIVRRYSQETSTLISIASDGQMIFWDISQRKPTRGGPEQSDERKAAELAAEKYQWSPLLRIDLILQDPKRHVGSLKIVLMLDSHFFCSSENGEILEGDINVLDGNYIKNVTRFHNGPVRSLQCSPFLDDVLLSVDIWNFALWKRGFEKPIYMSRSAEGYLTTGCWSPTRPGVIYIGLLDGSIEVWDLLDHSHQPSAVASIGSCQVTSMEFSTTTSTPQLLAVGDIQGALHIMEIPRRLRRMQHKEKATMQKFFERQQAWVKDVEERETERLSEAEKRREEVSDKQERKEQLSKCSWNKDMETEYRQYELQCRIAFGIPLPSTSNLSSSCRQSHGQSGKGSSYMVNDCKPSTPPRNMDKYSKPIS